MTTPPDSRRRFLAATAALAPVLVTLPAARAGLFDKGREALERNLGGDGAGGLSESRITAGLKEALQVASGRVVTQVGSVGGYLKDPAIHIPLPGFLGRARDALRITGAAGLLDDLERRLNRGAEAAAPKARDIFVESIGQMTLADARRILNGPDDAATQYFKRTMTPSLRETFRPVMNDELEKAGAIATFDETVAAYDSLSFVPPMAEDAKGRLIDHGLDGALSGLFHYLAKEEAAIRNDPAKRTTDLLKSVFG